MFSRDSSNKQIMATHITRLYLFILMDNCWKPYCRQKHAGLSLQTFVCFVTLLVVTSLELLSVLEDMEFL